MLWRTRAAIRYLLSAGDPETTLLALAPTTISWMRRLCHESERARLDRMQVRYPEWFRAFLDRQGVFAKPDVDRQGGGVHEFLADRDSDNVVQYAPLFQLVCHVSEVDQTRMRTIDSIMMGQRDCRALCIGSGADSLPLLKGAIGSIKKFGPILIIDAVSVVGGQHLDEEQIEALLADLPSYSVLKPEHARKADCDDLNRFAVLAPASAHWSRSFDDPPVHDGFRVIAYDARRLTILSGGRFSPDSERIEWDGDPSGIVVLLEAPLDCKAAAIKVRTSEPLLLRVFVDGAVSGEIASGERMGLVETRQGARELTISVELEPAARSRIASTIAVVPVKRDTYAPRFHVSLRSVTLY